MKLTDQILGNIEGGILLVWVICCSCIIWGWFTPMPWYGIVGIYLFGGAACFVSLLKTSEKWQALHPTSYPE